MAYLCLEEPVQHGSQPHGTSYSCHITSFQNCGI